MGPKYKVTGCARFFLFLIIFIPVVFFGAAYIRGENGVQMIKDFYHKMTGRNHQQSNEKPDNDETYQVEDLKKELDNAKAEIKALKDEIEEKEKEIEALKKGQ